MRFLIAALLIVACGMTQADDKKPEGKKADWQYIPGHGEVYFRPGSGDSYSHSTGLMETRDGRRFVPPKRNANGQNWRTPRYQPSPNYRPVVPYVQPTPQPQYPVYQPQPRYEPLPVYQPYYQPQQPPVQPYYQPYYYQPRQPYYCPTCPNLRPYGAIDPLLEKKTGMQECAKCGRSFLRSELDEFGVSEECRGKVGQDHEVEKAKMRQLVFLACCVVASLANGQNSLFTLVLIDNAPVTQGFGRMPQGVSVPSPYEQMLRQPQSAELAKWIQTSDVKVHRGIDPIVEEHHSDLLATSRSLPIIALVDSRGGTWCKFSDESLPTSEYDLARRLDSYYAATLQAGREAGLTAYDMLSSDEINQRASNLLSNPNDPRGPPSRGPRPFLNRNDGGLLNVRPNIIPPEGGIPVGVEGRVADKTLYAIVACVVIFVGGIVIAAWIISEAITDDDEPEVTQ